jgi:PAT family acetyl-CoA transporter-like MFS transporter 1
MRPDIDLRELFPTENDIRQRIQIAKNTCGEPDSEPSIFVAHDFAQAPIDMRFRGPKQTDVQDSNQLANADSKPESSLSGDWGNIILLLFLYTLQGVPMGLTQVMSMMIQERGVSLSEINQFHQVSWPFSLKLLWAPIVDSIFVKSVGLRKTWLLPVQTVIGLTLALGSKSVSAMLDSPTDGPDVWSITVMFFLLFFLCATQDICVDGWALTLLSPRNVGWASTCNAIGQTLGNLLYVSRIPSDF